MTYKSVGAQARSEHAIGTVTCTGIRLLFKRLIPIKLLFLLCTIKITPMPCFFSKALLRWSSPKTIEVSFPDKTHLKLTYHKMNNFTFLFFSLLVEKQVIMKPMLYDTPTFFSKILLTCSLVSVMHHLYNQWVSSLVREQKQLIVTLNHNQLRLYLRRQGTSTNICAFSCSMLCQQIKSYMKGQLIYTFNR